MQVRHLIKILQGLDPSAPVATIDEFGTMTHDVMVLRLSTDGGTILILDGSMPVEDTDEILYGVPA